MASFQESIWLLPSDKQHSPTEHSPTAEDVLTVKDFLTIFHPNSPLPLELIDAIIDLAEYWPHTTTSLSSTRLGGISFRAGGEDENKFMLRSLPLGFEPSKNDTEYQMLPEHQLKYPSRTPTPWPKDQEIPHDATLEVIKKWTEVSKPKGGHPCRKIVFKIKSHDQGWGGNRDDKGKFSGSNTWFDAGLERVSATREVNSLEAMEVAPWPQFRLVKSDLEPEIICCLHTVDPDIQANPDSDDEKPLIFKHDLHPSTKYIQKNKTAWKETQQHDITWRYTDDIQDPQSPEAVALEETGRGRESSNGEFVRNMKVGDVVTVWAKARYPGWCNIVEDISVEVYWAV